MYFQSVVFKFVFYHKNIVGLFFSLSSNISCIHWWYLVLFIIPFQRLNPTELQDRVLRSHNNSDHIITKQTRWLFFVMKKSAKEHIEQKFADFRVIFKDDISIFLHRFSQPHKWHFVRLHFAFFEAASWLYPPRTWHLSGLSE